MIINLAVQEENVLIHEGRYVLWTVVRQKAESALQSPVVITRNTKFNIQQFYVLPTQCIYVFCVDLRTNSD